MNALVLTDGGAVFRQDYPKPELREGDALVRVRQAGVCNTDLELLRGYATFRGVMGHEFVGQVVHCSDQSWVNRRAVAEINVSCGECCACRTGRTAHCETRTALGIRGRDGAFAEFVSVPIKNLYAVPDGVSDDQAVFVEPLAAALAITEQIHVKPTDQVVLLGDGKLGLLIAQVLDLTGSDVTVIGRHPGKLQLLADRGIHTLLVDSAGDGLEMQADIVIEATGTPAGLAEARRMVRPRGRLVLKSTYHGLADADFSSIVVDEIQLVGSRCGPFAPALRLLERRLVNVAPLIEARFPLSQGRLALEKAAQKGVLKVLIET
jgi:alcohol dehydrogenase